jgi:hypothetical protein
MSVSSTAFCSKVLSLQLKGLKAADMAWGQNNGAMQLLRAWTTSRCRKFVTRFRWPIGC